LHSFLSTRYKPEAEMRKEDRIRQQQQSQNPNERQTETAESRPTEQVKGNAPGEQPSRPPREPGKLPLPE
jgi:hypothetical protein